VNTKVDVALNKADRLSGEAQRNLHDMEARYGRSVRELQDQLNKLAAQLQGAMQRAEVASSQAQRLTEVVQQKLASLSASTGKVDPQLHAEITEVRASADATRAQVCVVQTHLAKMDQVFTQAIKKVKSEVATMKTKPQSTVTRDPVVQAVQMPRAPPPSKEPTPTPTLKKEPQAVEAVQKTVNAPTLRPGLRLVKRSTPLANVTTIPMPTTRNTSAPHEAGTSVREVRVAPVQAQPGLHFLPAPLVDSIMARHPGRFSGNAEDWPEWRRRWIPFLREVESAWPAVSDRQKLALFRSALDEAGALLLDRQMEMQGDVDYESYFAEVDLDYGGEDKEAIRKKMKKLKLPTTGKVTEKEWRQLYASMTIMAAQVGTPDVEVGRLLVDALPLHPWRRKVAQEEDHQVDHRAVLVGGLPADVRRM
jgi:peptidoglycan hydrolase-like protein with peptidoglycan-binding domain